MIPDFVVNAGRVIQVTTMRERWTEQTGGNTATGYIVDEILCEADRSGVTPMAVAE